MRIRGFEIAATAVVALCLIPVTAVVLAALGGGGESWSTLAATVLPRYGWTTLQLVLMVAVGTCIIGTGTAWLVTTCRFPGVRILEVALALPLAFPAYVLAYAYTDLLDHPGPVQSWLRAVTGWGPRDYWFPEIRSLGGAVAMLMLVLFPYVYLLARASFLQQSHGGYLAARVLGEPPWRAFMRVSLPMARPAIAGGVILTMMETIADYGTVAHFSVQTFATGLYQAWFSMGDRAAAAQLSLCLLSVALLLAFLERAQRGSAKRYPPRGNNAPLTPHDLTGWRALGAFLACFLPVFLGFLLPTGLLIQMAMEADQGLLSRRYLTFMRNSLTLASVAAVVTLLAAMMLAFSARLRPSRPARATILLAGLGYAVPGGVIAVGLLVPFAAFDNAFDGLMRRYFGISTGLLITGSIWLMVLAYMVRFMAAALNAFESGLSTLNPNIDAAARTLGTRPSGLLKKIHVPVLKTSLLTALLIVFVDVMKELPATLILRPFNFDTLAVQAHRLASDERLTQAAVPSLVIMSFGILPVVLLCRMIAKSSTQSQLTDVLPADRPQEGK